MYSRHLWKHALATQGLGLMRPTLRLLPILKSTDRLPNVSPKFPPSSKPSQTNSSQLPALPSSVASVKSRRRESLAGLSKLAGLAGPLLRSQANRLFEQAMRNIRARMRGWSQNWPKIIFCEWLSSRWWRGCRRLSPCHRDLVVHGCGDASTSSDQTQNYAQPRSFQ